MSNIKTLIFMTNLKLNQIRLYKMHKKSKNGVYKKL